MAIPRTSLLDLPLPVTGSLSGDWGAATNNGLTEYLDIAVAGSLVLNTDADVTLTSTDGDENGTNIGSTTAQYAILRWTATGSTTRNITVPAKSKTYIVINATGGTQSIVLRGAGPTTGVTIVSGEKAVCAWNGSDFVKVGGAAGGTNTQVQFNDNGVFGGSANLTWDGSTLATTGLTASGAVTLSATTQNIALGTSQVGGTWTAGGASQTGAITLDQSTKTHTLNIGTGATENALTKTINLGTAGVSGSTTAINIGSAVSGATSSISVNGALTASGNVTLSGGTANGVAYLNGSKALTTGTALTFDGSTLTATSSASTSGNFKATSSTAQVLNITASNDANTTVGLLVFGSAAGSLGMLGAGAPALYTAATELNLMANNASGVIKFAAGGTSEQMRLTSTGLGIGTSSPSSILDVQKAGTAAATTDLLELTNSGNAASMTNTGTGILFNQFYYDATTPAVADAGRIAVKTEGNWTSTGSTQDAYMTFETALDGTVAERARITSGGGFLVGSNPTEIGTNSVTTASSGSTANGFACLVSGYAAAFFGINNTASTIRGVPANAFGVGTADSVSLTFGTSNTERARITSDGDLLVGTTSTTLANGNAGVVIFASGRTAIQRNVDGGDSVLQVFGNAGSAYVQGDGDLLNTNNSYGALSDLKLKENISDATPKLDDLLQVRVVNYNLKTQPDQKHIGVIAQELEQVFPSMVSESLDRDADGNDLGTTTKSVKYSVFVPMLIKAIQEQQALIESLTSRVAQLEGTQP